MGDLTIILEDLLRGTPLILWDKGCFCFVRKGLFSMKPFKTLDEQMDILESRGLIIDNRQKTQNYLLEYSYYNVINMYSKFFQQRENTYIIGATFNEIRAVHIYDSEIKSTFFKHLIECEKHFKSIIAYRFSEQYANIPYAYLQTTSYSQKDLIKLSTTISLLSKTITTHIKDRNKNSIKHYSSNHNDVPLWVLINYLTFGQVVHMYTHFTDKLKNTIAKDIALYLEKNTGEKTILESKDIENILFNLLEIRNCVAHNNKLFNFKCRRNIKYIKSIHLPAHISKNSPRQDPFSCFLIMQLFLSKKQYALLHNTILKRTKTLNNKVKSIPVDTILATLGFPDNWFNDT